MSSSTPLKIGTRGSPLALAQAHGVRDSLIAAHPGLTESDIAIEVFKTRGDKITDRKLLEIGGKGLFTEEIEEALRTGDLDMAVHSMKDMPTELPDGLEIPCLLERVDPRDVLIAREGTSIAELKEGATVGTASLRREAQLRHLRPDFNVVTFRGNVGTRLKKLEAGEADATLLARAGLVRLGMTEVASATLSIEEMMPAPAQGAIGVECRAEDNRIRELLAPLNDTATTLCLAAERSLLAGLDGSCRTPIAAIATLDGETLHLRARLLAPDGSLCFATERLGGPNDGVMLGRDAAAELRARAGPDFIAAMA
ncbi:MAG TPA: hydroxymethylbilane synthase [Alphaproteobacteria bacterium]|nr:hydroxymethylbilane synthase [Alphaproteobacteria bacterium]